MSELQKLESFRYSLAVAETVEEIKLIKDATSAYHQLARRQKLGRDKLNDIGKFMVEVEIKLGEYLNKFHKRGGDRKSIKLEQHELDKMPVTPDESSRARTITRHKEEIQEFIEKVEKEGKIVTPNSVLQKIKHPIAASSGFDQWFTPKEIIDKVKAFYGGNIELDAASNSLANEFINAASFYDGVVKDGLKEPWYGNVFLNPPYKQPIISEFIEKALKKEYNQIIILINNGTETKHFQSLLSACDVVCFPNYRFKFIPPGGEANKPALQGQALFYIGPNGQKYVEEFKSVGQCLKPLL